ncbi:MAG: hypothetical protein ACYC54_15605 [Sedimentisphaerales bacterium]
MKCLECRALLKKNNFDIGYGIEVKSFRCSRCGFNITDEEMLIKAMNLLCGKGARKSKLFGIEGGLN